MNDFDMTGFTYVDNKAVVVIKKLLAKLGFKVVFKIKGAM